jgi:3'-phosphoadenosine 5'-phosphosulfate sulfotransferase (PAPS reductase)/FAD synthetase
MEITERHLKLIFLRQKQSLTLDQKIILSKRRIVNWYEKYDGNVYVAFSGGKDSTVLLHLVRELYPDVPAVFVDTGLEYPEIRDFITGFVNVEIIRPAMNFKKVLEKYGYPIISKKIARMVHDLKHPTEKNFAVRNLFLTGGKRDGTISKSFKLPEKWRFLIDAPFEISGKCCDVMKKNPLKKWSSAGGKFAFVGTMASDSQQRMESYLKTGCNSTKDIGAKSMPLSFWLESDIWDYIKLKDLLYCKIYDTGVSRTGCIYCLFGISLEKEPNRFQLLKATHPKLYEYCMNKLGVKEVLDFMNLHLPTGSQIPYVPNIQKTWMNDIENT